MELSIFAYLYNINISVYRLINKNDNYYSHYTNIWKDNDNNKYMIILYEGGNHFSLLKISQQNSLPNYNDTKLYKNFERK